MVWIAVAMGGRAMCMAVTGMAQPADEQTREEWWDLVERQREVIVCPEINKCVDTGIIRGWVSYCIPTCSLP